LARSSSLTKARKRMFGPVKTVAQGTSSRPRGQPAATTALAKPPPPAKPVYDKATEEAHKKQVPKCNSTAFEVFERYVSTIVGDEVFLCESNYLFGPTYQQAHTDWDRDTFNSIAGAHGDHLLLATIN
jgi:hypothetical protein